MVLPLALKDLEDQVVGQPAPAVEMMNVAMGTVGALPNELDALVSATGITIAGHGRLLGNLTAGAKKAEWL